MDKKIKYNLEATIPVQYPVHSIQTVQGTTVPGLGLVDLLFVKASESLTKITEFHDCGTKFELDRIFSFFFHIEGGCNARTCTHLSKTEFLAVVSKMAKLPQNVIFDIL